MRTVTSAEPKSICGYSYGRALLPNPPLVRVSHCRVLGGRGARRSLLVVILPRFSCVFGIRCICSVYSRCWSCLNETEHNTAGKRSATTQGRKRGIWYGAVWWHGNYIKACASLYHLRWIIMHDCKKLDYEAQWPRIIHHSRLLKNNGGCLSVRASGFDFQDPFLWCK